MLSLKNYAPLVVALPVVEQAFTAKVSIWQKQLEHPDYLALFGHQDAICLNRTDIKNSNSNKRLFVLKTILWGYSKGMRGKNFHNIYDNIDQICNILFSNDTLAINEKDLSELQIKLKSIKGLGMSTYTKFLYFRGFIVEDCPALILDRRLIDVFQKGIFDEFEDLKDINEHNKEKKYFRFLQIMQAQAEALGTTPEKLEQFLFIFGNHLKP